MTAADRLLVVGEALIDIVHRNDGSIDEHPGGSPLNVAIGLARLGHPVQYAARFGHDRHGQMIREHLAREELLTLTAGTDAAEQTSVAEAYLDAKGAATYHFDLTWDVGAALDLAPVGHLHTGSIAATLKPGADDVLAVARRTRDSGTISYDPNARPTIMGTPEQVRADIEALIALSDVVKASDEDVDWLYPNQPIDDVMDQWGAGGPRLVVVTRGWRGAYVLVTATSERATLPSVPAGVVDTVGAGDSFMAGLISGLLDAGLLGDASARQRLAAARLIDFLPVLDRASQCAAITVSRAGANPPTRADLG